jgi:hypothetical protein
MENSGLPKPPVGMLEVTVEKATGLKSADLLGKGDPYVRMQVRRRKIPQQKDTAGKEAVPDDGQELDESAESDEVVILKEYPDHRTEHKKNTKHPVWNEHFKVHILAPFECARAFATFLASLLSWNSPISRELVLWPFPAGLTAARHGATFLVRVVFRTWYRDSPSLHWFGWWLLLRTCATL